jgi:hypothetical protein
VTTDPNVNYTFAFKVYYETGTNFLVNSSIFIDFGATGALSLNLKPNQTLSHSSSSKGLGPSDHVKFTSYGKSGGRFILYGVSVTLL